MTTDANGAPQGESQEQTPKQETVAEGSAPFNAAEAFAGLEEDNRAWLTKQGFIGDNGNLTAEGFAKLGKHVYHQEKLVGGSIRIPGKDATPEERNAFLDKLGRREPDKYELVVPKDLPEELPYDGETAKAFRTKAHELGLTQEQAAGIHDWYAGQTVETYKGIAAQTATQKAEKAKAAVTSLEKEWGPIDGETAKANLQFADKVLEAGDPETITDLQAYGLIGPNKEIFSAPLAKLFAKVGSALFKEGEVLKGNPSKIGNPFDDKNPNMTEQMRMWKADPDHARSLMAAAGKKPSDFGLA